jgi:chlorophyll synthase
MARAIPAFAASSNLPLTGRTIPAPSAILQLFKPITWFPPMWAFGCGVVSSGASLGAHWFTIAAGIVLAGPLVCATSQAVNDWYDRHVDAINEPNRPIPSGRIPGRWGIFIAIAWTIVSMLLATLLGPWGFAAACFGMLLAWLYSAPPLRLKRNGWWGNAAVALCYEGLPWFTAAAIMAHDRPSWPIIAIALLYSVGAHGIMTLNDFKSIEGDKRMGIDSLPVLLGPARAASLACVVMAVPQALVVALLLHWGRPYSAIVILLLIAAQVILMQRFLQSPRERAIWYSACGVSLSVWGMMVTAVALHGVTAL